MIERQKKKFTWHFATVRLFYTSRCNRIPQPAQNKRLNRRQTNIFATNPAATILAAGLTLAGCTAEIRDLPATDIEHLVVSNPAESGEPILWSAPELEVRRFNVKIDGYNTIYYRLAASQDQPGAKTYRLEIDATYVSPAPRHYETAFDTNGEIFTGSLSSHNTLRCQVFGTMYSACQYRDRTVLPLNIRDLQQIRQTGMKLTLGTAEMPNEEIDIPAAYADGFLRAMDGATH